MVLLLIVSILLYNCGFFQLLKKLIFGYSRNCRIISFYNLCQQQSLSLTKIRLFLDLDIVLLVISVSYFPFFSDPAVEIAHIKGQDHVTGRRGEEGLRGHLAAVFQVAGDPGRCRGHPGGHQ